MGCKHPPKHDWGLLPLVSEIGYSGSGLVGGNPIFKEIVDDLCGQYPDFGGCVSSFNKKIMCSIYPGGDLSEKGDGFG